MHKDFEIPTLNSIVFEILKFVFLAEVAHRWFCAIFVSLISELRQQRQQQQQSFIDSLT